MQHEFRPIPEHLAKIISIKGTHKNSPFYIDTRFEIELQIKKSKATNNK